MPGFDRSGPDGAGPMTGRAMGRCTGNQPADGMYGRGTGRGAGRGAGYGAGRGAGYGRGVARGHGRNGVPAYDPYLQTPEAYRETLADRAAYLKAELSRTEALLGNQSAGDEPVQGGSGKE